MKHKQYDHLVDLIDAKIQLNNLETRLTISYIGIGLFLVSYLFSEDTSITLLISSFILAICNYLTHKDIKELRQTIWDLNIYSSEYNED